MNAQTYVHKEAFCLMQYRCDQCHCVEVLWNSRDGVTPFMITCVRCKGRMQHINWPNDRCAPDHTPERGQRVFMDTTREKAALYARQRIKAENTEYAVKPEDYDRLLASLTESFYGDGDQPDIVTF